MIKLKSPGFHAFWIGIMLFMAMTGVLLLSGTADGKVGPYIGDKAPDFSLGSLAAKNVQLYRVIKANKVTLINFWGVWCPYCITEIPELVRFYNQYHQRQVEILAVDVGDSPQEVPAFTAKNRMAFPVLIDKDNVVNSLYQIRGFPTTIIIDRRGVIKDIIVGATNQANLAAKVEAVLGEK
jgi:Peroxiredoxin